MSKIFSGSNPSQLYMDALQALLKEGEECAPRGKKIKELRPVIFEYTNPKNRVTFLKGRKINPFFQLAESLWILSGRSDVAWLTDYNANMGQFSDDGVYFNAPYGERLRFWNKNDSHGYIHNPIDQLTDVYEKIIADNDTRQAVAVIYNPVFDHAGVETKDRPCNLILTFKLRNGKLDLNVFNRSNDLHWGTFGANLCQFATIQEVIASWLGVEVGTYYQTTDSLHIYLDDYGAKETNKILKAYGLQEGHENGFDKSPVVDQYIMENEPRFTSDKAQFDKELDFFWNILNGILHSEQIYTEDEYFDAILETIARIQDDYLRMTYYAMLSYRAHKKGQVEKCIKALGKMPMCSWKISCLRFLSKRYKDRPDYNMLYCDLADDIIDYIECKEEE